MTVIVFTRRGEEKTSKIRFFAASLQISGVRPPFPARGRGVLNAIFYSLYEII
jgi:hypothetical protein